MIRVVWYASEAGVCGFEAKGHAGYGEYGRDIVCAAVSALLQTAAMGVKEVLGIPIRVRKRDRKGYLRAVLPASLEERERERAQVALNVARAGLKQIEKDYPGCVRVISRKWRYAHDFESSALRP